MGEAVRSVLLNAVTATGASTEFVLTVPGREHTIQMNITGAPTAVTVDLEGSLDGVKWHQLATHPFSAAELTAESAMFHVTNKPISRIRANLTTLTGGTSPTVTAMAVSIS